MEPIKTKLLFGTRFVPLHAGLDQIGGRVEWDNVAKRATVHANGKTILVTMAQSAVESNGSIIDLSEAPLVDDNVLYVPEDFFSRVVGQPVILA